LPQHVITLPEYAERFRCIAGACEDTCCQGWGVHVDKDSFEKYRSLPSGTLQQMMQARIKQYDNPQNQAAVPYAFIEPLADGACPFLSQKRLCMIQEEFGEAYLCPTCRVFPRSPHTVDGITEFPLTLSCPEAARLVLCDLKLLRQGRGIYQRSWDDSGGGRQPLKFYYWQIRESAISLLRQQHLAIWERLFLLGIFARRLEAIGRGDAPRDVLGFLRDFASATVSAELRTSMKAVVADPALQLEMVVRLVSLRVSLGSLSPRLLECLEHFAEGVGSQPGIAQSRQIAAYQTAFGRYYEPFFRRHPHMLENYLYNEIFRGAFPFRKALFTDELNEVPDIAKSYAIMIIQFAVIKGLLIGNAAYHKKGFAARHVVDVVQTAFKHFEHSSQFVTDAYELLAQRGLIHPHGLAILVRN
jgi:lysine-N-methylase